MVSRRIVVGLGTLIAAAGLCATDADARFGNAGMHGGAMFAPGQRAHAPLRPLVRQRLNTRWNRGPWRSGLGWWPLGYPVVDPFGPAGDVAADAAVSGPLPAWLLRPACRIETQSMLVPTEAGERRVVIRRCVRPLAAWPIDRGAAMLARDAAPEEDTTASVSERGACRVEARRVGSADGVQRTVRIHRC